MYGPDGLAVDYRQETPFFYNIRRFTFDNKLVEYAVDAGATLMEGIAVKDFHVTPNEVLTELRDGSTLESEVIIGAGGSFDLVARRIRADEGLPMKWRDEDIATALYFEIEVGREYMDHVYGSERISMAHVKFQGLDGYGWSFSKDTVLNVGIGCPRSTIRRAKEDNSEWDERQYLLDYVATECRGCHDTGFHHREDYLRQPGSAPGSLVGWDQFRPPYPSVKEDEDTKNYYLCYWCGPDAPDHH